MLHISKSQITAHLTPIIEILSLRNYIILLLKRRTKEIKYLNVVIVIIC